MFRADPFASLPANLRGWNHALCEGHGQISTICAGPAIDMARSISTYCAGWKEPYRSIFIYSAQALCGHRQNSILGVGVPANDPPTHRPPLTLSNNKRANRSECLLVFVRSRCDGVIKLKRAGETIAVASPALTPTTEPSQWSRLLTAYNKPQAMHNGRQ